MYNRILSLFARHTRIPSPFTHFGEKVVWYIWEKRGVYPEFTENPQIKSDVSSGKLTTRF